VIGIRHLASRSRSWQRRRDNQLVRDMRGIADALRWRQHDDETCARLPAARRPSRTSPATTIDAGAGKGRANRKKITLGGGLERACFFGRSPCGECRHAASASRLVKATTARAQLRLSPRALGDTGCKRPHPTGTMPSDRARPVAVCAWRGIPGERSHQKGGSAGRSPSASSSVTDQARARSNPGGCIGSERSANS
jgi:hypothetical protein